MSKLGSERTPLLFPANSKSFGFSNFLFQKTVLILALIEPHSCKSLFCEGYGFLS